MASKRVFTDVQPPADVSGAFSDVPLATVAGGAVAACTLGSATLVGVAVLPAQAATGLAVGGAFAALGEVERRTGSYLPFLDSKEERERKQARADKRNAKRDAKADAAFDKELEDKLAAPTAEAAGVA